MAPHSSVRAWRIPWTAEPGGLISGVAQSRTRLKQLSSSSSSSSRAQENSMDRGARWAIPSTGVAKSQPQLSHQACVHAHTHTHTHTQTHTSSTFKTPLGLLQVIDFPQSVISSLTLQTPLKPLLWICTRKLGYGEPQDRMMVLTL